MPFRLKFELWPDKNQFNSHGTRRIYPHRYEVAVYCQDILLWRYPCLEVKTDMSYVFPVPKKFDSWSKNVISGHFSVHFRLNSRRKKFF